MQEALSYLHGIQGIQGVAILRRDGQVLYSSVGTGTKQEVAGTLAASIFGAIGQSLERLDLGSLSTCLFEGTDGTIYLQGSGGHVLLVIANRQSHVGRIRLGLQHAASALQE